MSVDLINRAPTPIIPHTSETYDNSPQNTLATIRTCYCSKVISQGFVDVSESASPSNDDIKFLYQGRKYKVRVSGKGIFYLQRNAKGELFLVKDKKMNDFPCCDSKFLHRMSFV